MSDGNILGIGIDLVSVSRFKRALDRWGDRFTKRLFTLEELNYCKTKVKPEMHLAARFAAKEAFVKALGTGFTQGIRHKDVEIISSSNAMPKLALHNQAFVISFTKGIKSCHLSITHSNGYAVACVVATA